MSIKNKFIKATHKYNTFEKSVPAPYIRKSFVSDIKTSAKVVIAVCGFYKLYINGKEYTKGFLAPYISNTDDYIYYDEYDVLIDEGENVIAVMLGNGFQNNPGGYIWDFDTAAFRSAPMMALSLTYKNSGGEEIIIESDNSFKVCQSPIRFDDYRFGECYDANFELDCWNDKGFDDSMWKNAIETLPPRGELKKCEAAPIVKETEIKPVKIIEDGDGYIYDFGINNAGICRLNINGKKGQKITLQHAEMLKDGTIFLENVWFVRTYWERDKEIVHKDTYICKGEENETYTPNFVYHGFRYVKVCGITKEQATSDLLTYIVIHSDLKIRGEFSCSDDVINKLQELCQRSAVSNFHYFPTDCPHREKNGWTGDAAASCEYTMLNYEADSSYREWLRNICKSQNKEGAIPGIVPTSGWGFEWGNGPAWDRILAYIPYYEYIYRGETDMIKESASSFMAYLHYLTTRADKDGLIHIGLGDWCHVGGIKPPKAPQRLTDTVTSMEIANKMSIMFDAIGMSAQSDFAKTVALKFKNAVRENLIDYNTMTVEGNCQTSQAMCIYHKIFNSDEMQKAFSRLLEMIHECDDHMDFGYLGNSVVYDVLSEFGNSDLAIKMITRPDFPSFAFNLERGATTLSEAIELDEKIGSQNHHFWGCISAWFIKYLAGIHFNPQGNDTTRVDIKPSFAESLDYAKGYHIAPLGKIVSSWKRESDNIILTVQVPNGIKANISLCKGYAFEDGTFSKTDCSGEYKICRC